MKRSALLVALLVGCGSEPTQPTVPSPPAMPTRMIGGWSGSVTQAWVLAGQASGSVACLRTWLITQQNGEAFDGTYQTSGGADCASFGTIRGTTRTDGTITFRHSSQASTGSSACTIIGGGSEYNGFVSSGGTMTAEARTVQRCQVGRDTYDYQLSYTITMHRS